MWVFKQLFTLFKANYSIVDGTNSGLLIICSFGHLKRYNSQGLLDGSIYRKCQKLPNSKFGFHRLCASVIKQKRKTQSLVFTDFACL
jgi:hypothetical protein